MQAKKLLLSFLFISLIVPVAYGQEPAENPKKKLSLDQGSIESQFDFITSKSNSFQEYKVVKKTWLSKIESNILDSLGKMKNELAERKAAALAQNNKMTALQDSMATANSNLEAAITTKDSIAFLGIPTHKAVYNSIMWGLVLGLAALLIFFIYRFKRSHAVTAEAVRTLEETKQEFETHRKKALEREQKLNRRLQDELNKQMS